MSDSPPTEKNRIWASPLTIFFLGQIVMFMFWLAGASYFSGQFAQRFANLEVRVSADEAIQKRMDESGTNASRLGLTLDQNRLNEVENRVKYYEELSRRMPVIEAAIVRIEADIKEIKTSKK